MIGISALKNDLNDKINLYHKYNKIQYIEYGIDEIENLIYLKNKLNDKKNSNLKLAFHLPIKTNLAKKISSDDENKKFLFNIIREALIFNPLYFNLHLGFVNSLNYKKTELSILDNIAEYIEEILSLSPKLILYVENVYSFNINNGNLSLVSLGTNEIEFMYLFNKIKNDRLKFCYDLGHNLIEKNDYKCLLKKNDDLLFHFNVNDEVSDLHLGIQDSGKFNKEYFDVLINDFKFKYILLELGINEVTKTLEILNLK